MTHRWGRYTDHDTLQGVEQYRRSGLTLWTPTDVNVLEFSELQKIARSCSDLIDGTYKGNYPQSTKTADSFTESIVRGETLVFALTKHEKVVATASLVHRPNSVRGKLSFVELSKTAKHAEYAKDIQARYLSKYRMIWAAENLPQVDFLYGSPRAALEGRDGIPGGKQAQSVWWGGHRHDTPLPLIVTNVGWNFRVGGIEPLTGFTSPLDTKGWSDAVCEIPVFVSSENVASDLRALIREGSQSVVAPTIQVLDDNLTEEPFFREARKPSPDIVSKYYVTKDAYHLPLRSSTDINTQLSSTVSQKVIIESDVATTERGAHVMRWLLATGWTFTGWQPSEVLFGGICPVLARVNGDLVHELIEPVHYPQYFDEGGLVRTKQILDGMYNAMRSNASRS